MDSRKRLIFTSLLSIILVSILFIGTTYSVFTSSEIDENTNVYKTGNLDITYTLSDEYVTLNNSKPLSINNGRGVMPYRITVTNNGNVAYAFDIALVDTTAGEKIDYQYIVAQVGKLKPVVLGDCENNIIQKEVVVPANSSIDVDVRVWLLDTVLNSEIGKSFYAKFSIIGSAVYEANKDIDNSKFIAYRPTLMDVDVGSYIAYSGDNGCSGDACLGKNANYVDEFNMGYCDATGANSYKSSGFRIAYSDEDSIYLVSAGAVECINLESSENSDDYEEYLSGLNKIALKYCNSSYAYGDVCDSDSAWIINTWDFKNITASILDDDNCIASNEDEKCGYKNDLIDVGGDYFYMFKTDNVFDKLFYWNPNERYVTDKVKEDLYGVRPILKLKKEILIKSGKGTYAEPYVIEVGSALEFGNIFDNDKSIDVTSDDNEISSSDSGVTDFNNYKDDENSMDTIVENDTDEETIDDTKENNELNDQ